MTKQEFDDYKLAVAWRHVGMTRNLVHKIRLGTPYDAIYEDMISLTLLDNYFDILLEYTLPTTLEESQENFLSPENMKNIALKINKLTGLRYNYDFKSY